MVQTAGDEAAMLEAMMAKETMVRTSTRPWGERLSSAFVPSILTVFLGLYGTSLAAGAAPEMGLLYGGTASVLLAGLGRAAVAILETSPATDESADSEEELAEAEAAEADAAEDAVDGTAAEDNADGEAAAGDELAEGETAPGDAALDYEAVAGAADPFRGFGSRDFETNPPDVVAKE